ncbi:hypothetical protein D3C85_1373880 [compost metagenome]
MHHGFELNRTLAGNLGYTHDGTSRQVVAEAVQIHLIHAFTVSHVGEVEIDLGDVLDGQRALGKHLLQAVEHTGELGFETAWNKSVAISPGQSGNEAPFSGYVEWCVYRLAGLVRGSSVHVISCQGVARFEVHRSVLVWDGVTGVWGPAPGPA